MLKNTLTYRFGVITGNFIGILLITLYIVIFVAFGIPFTISDLFGTFGGTLWLFYASLLIFCTIPSAVISIISIILLIIDCYNLINKKIEEKDDKTKNQYKFNFGETFGIGIYALTAIYGLIWLLLSLEKFN